MSGEKERVYPVKKPVARFAMVVSAATDVEERHAVIFFVS
jgi:hypothetical protein